MPSISTQTAQRLRDTRNYDEKTRKRMKAAIFADIKREHRIPPSQKIKFEIDDSYSSSYLVIKDATTGLAWQAPPPPAPPMEARYVPPVRPTANANQVKPAMPGLGVDPANFNPRPVPRETAGPTMQLGSISLDDAAGLLRIEGDTRSSFQKSVGPADNVAFVRDGRLFFIL